MSYLQTAHVLQNRFKIIKPLARPNLSSLLSINDTSLPTMAELSIACAVLAFIGASVDTVDAVRELISSIRGAPRGAKILLQELDELGRVFKRLNELSDKIKKCPEQDLHSSAPSQDFRDRCTSDLDELHKLVNGIHLQLTRRGYRRVVARIKWSVSEKTPISRLMSRIQTHRDLLMTFLSELQRSV